MERQSSLMGLSQERERQRSPSDLPSVVSVVVIDGVDFGGDERIYMKPLLMGNTTAYKGSWVPCTLGRIEVRGMRSGDLLRVSDGNGRSVDAHSDGSYELEGADRLRAERIHCSGSEVSVWVT